MQKVRTAT